MASAVFRTTKLYDGQLYKLVSDLLEIIPEGFATVTYALNVSLRLNSETDFSDLCDKNDRLITSLNFNFPGTVQEIVGFHRGIVDEAQWNQYPDKNGFVRSIPNAHFDEIGLLEAPRNSYGGQSPAPDKLDRETVFSVIRLPSNLSVESSFVGQNASATTLADIVSGEIGELRKLHLEMTSGLAVAQKEADKLNAKRRAGLEEEANDQRKLLHKKENEIEARRLELNDREPQHERRRLREHLTERLQTTITQPMMQTGQRERFSHYLYLVTALMFVSFSVGLTWLQNPSWGADSAAFWTISIKSLLSGAAGAAFAWAGLSGLKGSAIATREYEQSIQRYAFDMDRASWIVETILQMNTTEKSIVPEEWLESVCRDLFANGERGSNENRSLDAFAALFDATAKARIGTNGIEFEVDRKGARRLAQEA